MSFEEHATAVTTTTRSDVLPRLIG